MRRAKNPGLIECLFLLFAGLVKFYFLAMAWIVKALIRLLAWLLPELWAAATFFARLLLSVVRGIGRGVAWIVRENAEESKRLDAVRREIWEARLDRWLSRRADECDEEEPEEWEEEEDLLPVLLPETVDAPELPPMAFQFVDDLPEVREEPEEGEPDPGEDDCFSLLPGGCPEKALPILERRLAALYTRKEKAEYVNRADERGEAWEKYTTTKAWRGLLWEIDYTEKQIELIERAVG